MKKAVILLSGGMDSATVLAYARNQGYTCHALSFRYGQRHSSELLAAENLARHYDVEHKVIDLDLSRFGGSALTDNEIDVPDFTENNKQKEIPVTYVPARNTVFLSVALAWAEVLHAHDIFIGVNAVDYSGYPDCRPEFIEAFEKMANLATREAVEGNVRLTIHTPLIDLSKAEIIKLGNTLDVDYSKTITCYQADKQGRACGHCDACMLRKKGFEAAGCMDNTRYIDDKNN